MGTAEASTQTHAGARFEDRWHISLRALAIALAITALVGAIAIAAVQRSLEERARLEGETRLSQIDRAVTACTNLTYTTAEVIRAKGGTVDDFNELAKGILEQAPYYYNVQLAPGDKVTDVYPPTDSDTWSSDFVALYPQRVSESIQTGDPMVSGPYTMGSGRMVVLIQQPVYLERGDTGSFWGFVCLGVDVNELLEAFGIDSGAEGGYRYSLSATMKGREILVSGEPGLVGVKTSMDVSGRTWNIYVEPSIGIAGRLLIVLVGATMLVIDLFVAQLVYNNRSLRTQSTVDALTGLMNRRGFDRELARLGTDPQIHQAVVIAIDVNKFKTFNDRYGHHNGDELLKALGADLTALVGNAGIVARNGGDEFGILLVNPKKGWEGYYAAFFQGTQRFKFEDEVYKYHISAGYSVYPDQGTDAYGLCRKADTALYHAKLSQVSRFWQYSSDMLTDSRTKMGFSFADLAAGAPASVLIVRNNDTRKILYANERCLRLFNCGDTQEFMDYCDGSLRNLVHPDDRERVEREVMASTDPEDYDCLVLRALIKDGQPKTIMGLGRLIDYEYYGEIYYILLWDSDELAAHVQAASMVPVAS